MFFSSSWIKKMQIKYKKMDKITKVNLLGCYLYWIKTKLTKGCGTKTWSYPTSEKHIRTLMHGLSKQGETLQFPPSVTTDLITWQEWKQWYPVCASLCCREKHTHRPQIVCFLSTTNKDDPCLLPIYTHFLFFCFYWVLLFTLAFFFFFLIKNQQDLKVKLTAVSL